MINTDNKWTPEYKREYMKEWRRKNKLKIKGYGKKWREDHTEELKEYHNDYMKEWRKIPKNKIKLAAYQRRWYRDHPGYHKDRSEEIERQRIADRQKEIEQMDDIMIG